MSLDPLLHASPVIQIHAAAALLAFVLGAIQLYRRKGDNLHRAIGRTWVGLMAVVALSSFLIWTIRLVGPFSPIHLISIFVLVMLWLAVAAARRGDIARHARTMQLTYILGLLVTGVLTFLPGRIMGHVAFGNDGASPRELWVAAIVLTVGTAIFIVVSLIRHRQLARDKVPFGG